MKKILILFMAAFAAVSCLKGGSFSQSYTADITFDFTEDVYTNVFKDSLYIVGQGEEAFYYGSYFNNAALGAFYILFKFTFPLSCLAKVW